MKIEKTEYGYQVTECDIKFGEQITLDGELLIPISDIEDIKAEIKNDWQLKCMPSSPFSCGMRKTLEIIDRHISGKEIER